MGAAPSRRSRVTPGVSSTSASRRPASRLNSVDLPTFGRPTMATVKLMVRRCPRGRPRRRSREREIPRHRVAARAGPILRRLRAGLGLTLLSPRDGAGDWAPTAMGPAAATAAVLLLRLGHGAVAVWQAPERGCGLAWAAGAGLRLGCGLHRVRLGCSAFGLAALAGSRLLRLAPPPLRRGLGHRLVIALHHLGRHARRDARARLRGTPACARPRAWSWCRTMTSRLSRLIHSPTPAQRRRREPWQSPGVREGASAAPMACSHRRAGY